METKQLITRSMARIPERTYYRFQGLQKVALSEMTIQINTCVFPFPTIRTLELTPITHVFICPESIVMPYNKHYILIAFDYEIKRNPMRVVKITERYTTSSFKERISKN